MSPDNVNRVYCCYNRRNTHTSETYVDNRSFQSRIPEMCHLEMSDTETIIGTLKILRRSQFRTYYVSKLARFSQLLLRPFIKIVFTFSLPR